MSEPSLVALSLGAGVQSSTLVEMVVEGELPRPDMIVFADTGNEPQYVYDQVVYLAGRLAGVGLELTRVTAGDMVEDVYGPGRFAAMPLFTRSKVDGSIGRLRRQCTNEYKVAPIHKAIKAELLRRGLARQQKNGVYVNKGVFVETWLGISLDEVERMRPSRDKWQHSRWPLVERRMRRGDCMNWLTRHGLPVPGKSSCILCPYHDDAHFNDMRDTRPDDWGQVVEFDHDLRNNRLRLAATLKGDVYLHRTCIPIGEVDLDPNRNQMAFAFCDEGYCWA